MDPTCSSLEHPLPSVFQECDITLLRAVSGLEKRHHLELQEKQSGRHVGGIKVMQYTNWLCPFTDYKCKMVNNNEYPLSVLVLVLVTAPVERECKSKQIDI